MKINVVPTLRVATLWGLALLGFAGSAFAQTSSKEVPAETVTWTASTASKGVIKAGDRLKLTLEGSVAGGWHVYSLKQLPGGPTPLRVGIDANEIASVNGVASGSKPITIHDRAFNLDTQYYERSFTLTVPVRLAANASGRRHIPVNVRFQTCNGQICQPPKTVHLSVPVDIQANG